MNPVDQHQNPQNQAPAYPPQQTIIVMGQNQKSVGLAFILSFLFGPLGLFYSSVTGGIIMLIIDIPVAIFTLGFGLIFTNIICVIWAISAVNKHNSQISRAPQMHHYQQPAPPPGSYMPPVQNQPLPPGQ